MLSGFRLISYSSLIITGAGKTRLLVDIQTVRYIRESRLFYSSAEILLLPLVEAYETEELKITACGNSVSYNVCGFHWEKLRCQLPILGQFIYIMLLLLCFIVLNIYSPVRITASNQKEGYGSI